MRALFPGHYRPTEEEFGRLWGSATIAFDANVLLGVYRYTVATRNNLLAVLSRLRDRLWLPYQAAFEFQRNRLAVIASQAGKYGEALTAFTLQKETLLKHPFLEPIRLREASALASSLTDLLEKARDERGDLTSDDPLRAQLDDIFHGRVGPPYSPEQLQTHEKEARRRIESKIPPGYADAKKDSGSGPCGDFILWQQLIDHARETKTPAILVTDERKDDWWLRQDGRTIGPRPELVEEFTRITELPFYLYRSDNFLEHAQQFLNMVDAAAVAEVRQRRKERTVDPIDQPYAPTLWGLRAAISSPAYLLVQLYVMEELSNTPFLTLQEIADSLFLGDVHLARKHLQVLRSMSFFRLSSSGHGKLSTGGRARARALLGDTPPAEHATRPNEP